jgi:hypothetical protein
MKKRREKGGEIVKGDVTPRSHIGKIRRNPHRVGSL